jgi:type I restriction enzyme S subunit
VSLTISPARIVEESGSPLLASSDSWQRRPLGEVATIFNGGAFKSSKFVNDGGKPLIRIRDIFNEKTAITYVGEYDPRYLVQTGDLLVGMDGEFNSARWRGAESLLNQRVCKVTPDPQTFDMGFLAALLPGYLKAIHDLTSSTTVTHLSSRDIAQLPVPVPPLSEQRAISTMIRSVGDRRSDVIAHLAVALRAMDTFRRSVLFAACTGRLTADWRSSVSSQDSSIALDRRRKAERSRLGKKYRAAELADPSTLPDIPEGWCWAALPELGEMGRGKSKHRPRNDSKLYGGAYPFIQTGDVARSGGLIVSHSQTYNELGLAQSRLWPTRTVCITIAANIADTALLTYPACFPDSVVGIVADEAVALPEYIELFLRTARNDLATFAPATAQSNINLAILSAVAVALPSLAEQQQIVHRVTRLYDMSDLVAEKIEQVRTQLEKSSNAVLAKAFRGDLLVSST